MNKKVENRFYELYDLYLRNLEVCIGQLEYFFIRDDEEVKNMNIFSKFVAVSTFTNMVIENLLKENNKINKLLNTQLEELFDE